MTVIVTGAAGFIGFHVSRALMAQGRPVIGIDSLNAYYDPALKQARLRQLQADSLFQFYQVDIADEAALAAVFERHADATHVLHLAAQAGVRYSLENPYAYVDSNVRGHVAILEQARRLPRLAHLVYASSSSVYGGNKDLPFAIGQPVDKPISLYAATKRAGELIAEVYGRLYDLPQTGLRYFTVYGPWGRPDMAAYLFTDAIVQGRPIKVFNHGRMARDFTYIDDVVAGTVAALETPPAGDQALPTRLYNLGNHRPEKLLDFIAVLEDALGRTAEKEFLPMQPGDVPETYADIAASQRDLGFAPHTPITEGIPRFVAWYRDYHNLT